MHVLLYGVKIHPIAILHAQNPLQNNLMGVVAVIKMIKVMKVIAVIS